MNKYGEEVKQVLNSWADEAESIGDSYLKANLAGITELSFNAHALNSLVSSLSKPGAVNNINILKGLGITAARMVRFYQEVQRQALEKEKSEETTSKKPTTRAKKTSGGK